MKIKALLSFTGAVTMHPGEERTVSDKTGLDLVRAGLAIKLDEPEEPKTEETKAVKNPLKEKAVKEA